MIFDFESPECPDPGPADVCLVGAGAAGILLATQLAAAGLRVTLLEGGGRILELRSQDIYRSEVTGLRHNGINQGRWRTFGGSTTEWGGQILELDEQDFQHRDWVPGSGWPFPKSTLTEAYARVLQFAGLRRVQLDDKAVWAALGLQPPDLSPELSMSFSRWCPERNFAHLHGRTLEDSRKISVFCHANATALQLNPAQTAIEGVAIRNYAGRAATVSAKAFVLCLGGIETTRFLLQPASSGTLPWQTNGLLGRYYQDHIGCNGIPLDGLSTQPPHKWFGFVVSQGYTYHNKIRLPYDAQKADHTLNVAGTINPVTRTSEPRSQAEQILRRARAGVQKITPADAARIAPHLPYIAGDLIASRLRKETPPWKSAMLTVHCEQSPFSASMVSLSDSRDPLGMLRSRIDWKISPEEIHTIRTFVRICESAFREHGFARVLPPRGFFDDDSVILKMSVDNFHHMGSTRMSDSPQSGIVDPDLKLHGIANGYVCSSSVFPSSGFSNPTHTLLALGIRLADRLARQHGPSVAIPVQPVAAPSAQPLVQLPGGRVTSQLGFGGAYLLGPGLDRTKSRRLLDAAWDAGIRHFDFARLYGQGHTEALAGEFLRHHPEATVTTKYGIYPHSTPRRIAIALQRRIPPLRNRFPSLSRSSTGRFNAAEASESLDRSLRLLGRDSIDLFLLHEPRVEDLVNDDLLAFLEASRAKGKIGDFGIGGEYSLVPRLYAERRPYCRVLQFEWSLLGPTLDLPGVSRIHYRVFAKAAAALSQRLHAEPEMAARWSAIVGAELDEPAVLTRLLLKAALDAWPESVTLFSTASEAHIFDNAAVAADRSLSAPASRLASLLIQEKPLPPL